MSARQKVPLIDKASRRCPICGTPIKVATEKHGWVTSQRAYPIDIEFTPGILAGVDSDTAEKLREERKGKKTVAIVGMSLTTCSLAPFEEKDVDIWGVNEMHAFAWFKRATGWFQLHNRESFMRDLAKRNVYGHYDWLQKERGYPIYMQFRFDDIPDSVEYPLQQISKRFLGKVWKGEKHFKYFTSTFAYMMALALYQDYDRIEIYGFDMGAEDEFVQQKACAEFWMGLALGLGKEIYMPPNCQLCWAPLYGYQSTGSRNVIGGPLD